MKKEIEKISLDSYNISIEERFEHLSLNLFGVGTRIHSFSLQYKLDIESELNSLDLNFVAVISRVHNSHVERSSYNLYIIEEEVLLEYIITTYGDTKINVSCNTKNDMNKPVNSILHLLKKVTKNPDGDTFLIRKSHNNKWFPIPFKFQPNEIKLEHFLEPLEVIKLKDISNDILSKKENYYPIVRVSGPYGTGQFQVVHSLLSSLGQTSYTLDLTDQTELSERSMNNLNCLLLDKKNIALIICGLSKKFDFTRVIPLLVKKAVFAPIFIVSQIDIFYEINLKLDHPLNIQTINTYNLNQKQISRLNDIYSTEIFNPLQWSLNDVDTPLQWSLDDFYSIKGNKCQQPSYDIDNDILL